MKKNSKPGNSAKKNQDPEKGQLKCWEFFKCTKSGCPAYISKDIRCWLVPQTQCHDSIQGEFIDKVEMCIECEVFNRNLDADSIKESLMMFKDEVREYSNTIKDQNQILHNSSLEMAIGLSEAFEALKKIAAGDPEVRISEESKDPLIRQLKKVINQTGVNIAKIVNQSHEFAIALAEHFAVLQEVSRGNLNARVEGSSDVELLESLKNLTNNMVSSVSNEMSNRRRAEEELRKAYNKLREAQAQLVQSGKMAAVGQLAAGIAHEINNPMAVILGFSQAILKHLEAESVLRMPAESIEREAKRCKQLVEDLLIFSRSAKKEKEHVELNEIVRAAIKLAGHQTKMDNIKIKEEMQGKVPLFAEKNGIEQIVINLLVNAHDAMSGPGTITVKTQKDDDYVYLYVRDTGAGIKKENIEKIFEPFFTTKEVGKGTGLGLSLVYEIVKRHKGEIKVDSEPGKGTCFTIKLALAEEPKKYKVLIIDDDKNISNLLCSILNKMDDNIEVFSASDGYEGVIKVGEIHPDLVTMDIKMPKMDGIEACRQIRQHYSKDEMKIVSITAYAGELSEQIKTELGIDEIITKPVDVKSLQGKVKDLLHREERTV